jgi:hypothetical protein
LDVRKYEIIPAVNGRTGISTPVSIRAQAFEKLSTPKADCRKPDRKNNHISNFTDASWN